MKLDAPRGTRIHAYISVSTYMVFHRRVHFVPWDVVFHSEWFCGPTIDYRDYRPQARRWANFYDNALVQGGGEPLQTTDCGLQTTDHRLQRLQTEDYRLQTIDYRDYRLTTTDYRP